MPVLLERDGKARQKPWHTTYQGKRWISKETMDQKERRLHVRKPLSAEGQIRGPQGQIISCKLQNISDVGAMVTFDNNTALPGRFVFEIEGNIPISRVCSLAWRDGIYAGMEFVCRGKKRRAAILPI
jgi:hypothetical protein